MSQFQSKLTYIEEASGEFLSEMEHNKLTHAPTRAQNKVCGSSMTSGNTKLIDLAKAVAVFLYLYTLKP